MLCPVVLYDTKAKGWNRYQWWKWQTQVSDLTILVYSLISIVVVHTVSCGLWICYQGCTVVSWLIFEMAVMKASIWQVINTYVYWPFPHVSNWRTVHSSFMHLHLLGFLNISALYTHVCMCLFLVGGWLYLFDIVLLWYRSFQPGVSKPNVKPKDIQQGTRIGG